MGRYERSGHSKREILSLLRGTLSRYFFLHQTSSQIFVLHCQCHYSLRWNFILISACIPFTIRFWRKGRLMIIVRVTNFVIVTLLKFKNEIVGNTERDEDQKDERIFFPSPFDVRRSYK